MTRKTRTAAKTEAPTPTPGVVAGTNPAAAVAAPAPTGAVTAPAPESTLGDGDATGAAAEASPGSAAPEAPAPDVVTETPQLTAAVKEPVVRVVGPAKGRWRAGRKFTPEPVEIPASELTFEDLEKLTGDPELLVTIVD